MVSGSVGIKPLLKAVFLDRPAVKRSLDRATRGALARAGGLIRKIARQSIRKRRGPSKPGQPPHSHRGRLQKEIWFGLDMLGGVPRGVAIGPLRFGRSDVPRLLEYGGRKKAKRATHFRDPKHPRHVVTVPAGATMTWEPRLYMGPALEKAKPKIPEKWRNSIRRGA